MKFDWKMVKKPQTRSEDGPRDPGFEPRPVPQRFDTRLSPTPVGPDGPTSLLDFIRWCVPEDPSQDLGAFSRLYSSLSDENPHPEAPAPR